MAELRTRKLTALALCNLLPTRDVEVLKYACTYSTVYLSISVFGFIYSISYLLCVRTLCMCVYL